MAFEFEELDYQHTRLGAISLRKRAEPRLDGVIVYEVKLGDEYLMSSLFTEAEVALARLALGCFPDQTERSLDVIVGGLGLGYTAAAALEHEAVGTLTVIELLPPVIDWHRRKLVPASEGLIEDPRCRFVNADFFALASNAELGLDLDGLEQVAFVQLAKVGSIGVRVMHDGRDIQPIVHVHAADPTQTGVGQRHHERPRADRQKRVERRDVPGRSEKLVGRDATDPIPPSGFAAALTPKQVTHQEGGAVRRERIRREQRRAESLGA